LLHPSLSPHRQGKLPQVPAALCTRAQRVHATLVGGIGAASPHSSRRLPVFKDGVLTRAGDGREEREGEGEDEGKDEGKRRRREDGGEAETRGAGAGVRTTPARGRGRPPPSHRHPRRATVLRCALENRPTPTSQRKSTPTNKSGAGAVRLEGWGVYVSVIQRTGRRNLPLTSDCLPIRSLFGG
jgi:hypothetical protein